MEGNMHCSDANNFQVKYYIWQLIKSPVAISEVGFHSPSGLLYYLFSSLPFLLKKKERFSQIAYLSDLVFSKLYFSKSAPILLAYQKLGPVLKSKQEMIVAQTAAVEVMRRGQILSTF